MMSEPPTNSPFDVELRDRRPVGVVLDALADVLVLEHVDGLQVVDAAGLQDLDGAAGKAAHRELRRALHEQHHAVALDEVVDALLNVAHGAAVLPSKGSVGYTAKPALPPRRRGQPPAAARLQNE